MFTPLETAVLDLILDKPGEEFNTAQQQLAHATVSKRDFSGVGFLQIGRVHRGSSPTRFAEYGD
jgi:hypothetical protein